MGKISHKINGFDKKFGKNPPLGRKFFGKFFNFFGYNNTVINNLEYS